MVAIIAPEPPRTPEERDRDLDALLAVWSDPPGVRGWLSTIDAKRIAQRTFVTAFVFFALAGMLAMAMRTQLSSANGDVLDAVRYHRLLAMHGAAMVFLFAVPVMQAFAAYMLPLMLGARGIAFPRLGAFAYWVYLSGGVTFLLAFLAGGDGAAGWSGNAPLARTADGIDLWAQAIVLVQLSAVCVAVQLLATILGMRAPGMTLARMPLFAWAMLVASGLALVAAPAVILGNTFLVADRVLGTHFFDAAGGGDPLLWRHLSWSVEHPAAYVIFLPALGMASGIVEAFARRPMYGYKAMAGAFVALAVIALAAWLRPLLANGASSPRAVAVATAMGLLAAVPAGVLVFCWLATLRRGRPGEEDGRIAVPLLFVLGFLALLAIAGPGAAMLASAPLGLQLHGTYFAVAHLHYALIGGAVFPLMGAVYFWFPKITGRMLSQSVGRLQFWLLLIGANLTFLPMYALGLLGMPRRIYSYPPGTGWGLLNTVASLGAWMVAASLLVFAANVALALRRIRGGRPAGDNPWGAPDLAWATRSPPPPYNFDVVPVVRGRTPLWPLDATLPVMGGVRPERREVLLTTPRDAEVVRCADLPEPGLRPLAAALALLPPLLGSAVSAAVAVGGAIVGALVLFVVLWPRPVPAPTDAPA